MNATVKRILKRLLPDAVVQYMWCIDTVRRKYGLSRFGMALKLRPVISRRKYLPEAEYISQMKRAFRRIRPSSDYGFIYPYDPMAFRQIRPGKEPLASVTVDFAKVLGSTVTGLRSQLEGCPSEYFAANCSALLTDVTKLAQRIDPDGEYALDALLDRRPASFREALQKILFYDALFWQAGHAHIGLGRLDMLLWEYYDADIRSGALDRDGALEQMKDFCRTLDRDLTAKSQMLRGDTGQYILLGGTDGSGAQVCNELTHLWIRAVRELHLPDPKIILRVGRGTADELWREAAECLMTGIGSPLLMNEDVIIPAMEGFGYAPEDCAMLGTSACWEPLIIGKSFDQNNPLPSVIALSPLDKMLHTPGVSYSSFDEFLAAYKSALTSLIQGTARDIDFDCSPLFSLFVDDCIANGSDFSGDGARYSYHGMQLVSLPNTVNALLAIRQLVFEDGRLKLEDCAGMLDAGFTGYDDILAEIRQLPYKFGSDDPVTSELTRELIGCIEAAMDGVTINGRKAKIGLSSPSFINSFPASMDGRKAGDPFAVHISPISSDIGLLEIIDFAVNMEYGAHMLNGNVVDFTIPPAYMAFPEKLAVLLKDACERGVFELQLGVLDYELLVDARNHPEKYPDLIVRVWGFSAYFNDLPDEYKNNLIARAATYRTSV